MNLDLNVYYNTVSQNGSAEFSERGSKFIALSFPIETVEAFKNELKTIKKEHPKATHHCFAYRLGLDGNNFRSSDDGEPSGSAGKPILGQIDSKQITNALVVVVRYFGGTQLGIPGLINAYKTATSLALQTTPVVARPVLAYYKLDFDYTQMNSVMQLIKQFECKIICKETSLFCSMEIGIPKNRVEVFINNYSNAITFTSDKGISASNLPGTGS